MSAAAVFEERIDPGRFTSALLAAVVHALLLAVLVFGVSWQNRPPESIAVELWEPPPPAPVQEAPKLEPAPPAAVKPEPVKPEPVLAKPEIVEKKAPPPKPVPKAEPKPVPKAEPLKPKVDDTQKRIRAELAREQASLALNREIRDQLARDAAAASNKSLATWIDRIKIKIRNNILLPPGIQGNPEAIFDVVQLPTGEILSVKLRKSSGVAALDNAIERAVLKSSPLPKPDGGVAAPREFELKYKPLD